MNLYIFNETRRGAVYGVGTYIRELTAALKRSDMEICVVNLISDRPHIQTEEADGIRQWYFPAPISEQRSLSDREQRELYHRNAACLLRLYIKDTTGLIFHLNFPQSGILAEELKKAFDCRIVSVIHFSDWGFKVFDNLPRLRNILSEEKPDSFGEEVKKSVEEERVYYAKADHIICLSNYMRDILCRDYGIEKANISVIPNGLSDEAALSTDRKPLREKWHIQDGEKIILFAGRLDEIKGVSFLIDAFRQVLTAFPQSRLVIAGAGDFNRYTKEAQDLCTKITYTGFLDKEQLYEWYRLADIGVIPSLFEPFGFVPVEMMMHCLPVVVTATSGMDEVVDDTCGLKVSLIPSPDKVETDTGLLAEKIIYLLQHPEEARILGENGRKRYEREYTSCIFGKNMTAFYKSFLSCKNK